MVVKGVMPALRVVVKNRSYRIKMALYFPRMLPGSDRPRCPPAE